MLLWSHLGVKPTWLLRERGNSALDADPRIPPNQKTNPKNELARKKSLQFCCILLDLTLGKLSVPIKHFTTLEPRNPDMENVM